MKINKKRGAQHEIYAAQCNGVPFSIFPEIFPEKACQLPHTAFRGLTFTICIQLRLRMRIRMWVRMWMWLWIRKRVQLQSSDRLNVILGYIGVSKNDAIINSCAPGAGQPGGQGTFQAAARLPKNQKAKRAVISTDTMSQPTSQQLLNGQLNGIREWVGSGPWV